MKRSKMAGKLLHWLTINGYSTTDGHDTYTLNASDAYNIIDYLEREGMTPPLYTKELTKKQKRLSSDYLGKLGFKKVNEWEPEDE